MFERVCRGLLLFICEERACCAFRAAMVRSRGFESKGSSRRRTRVLISFNIKFECECQRGDGLLHFS